MTALSEALGGHHLVVEIPDADLPDWMTVLEICLQEDLGALALPAARPEWFADALAVFGHRARIGVWGVTDAEQASGAAQAGVHFLTSPVADAALVAAADGVPVILGALTPTEAVQAVALGAVGVQIVPADALGMPYSRALPKLLPHMPLLATGRLERFQAEMWLQAGAEAVVLAGMVLTDDMVRPGSELDLTEVRRRAQSYRLLDPERQA